MVITLAHILTNKKGFYNPFQQVSTSQLLLFGAGDGISISVIEATLSLAEVSNSAIVELPALFKESVSIYSEYTNFAYKAIKKEAKPVRLFFKLQGHSLT